MRIAQKLYEDGRITYMRTDSTNLSELAIKDISSAITKEYGSDFVKVRHYHTSSKGAQEAHEAIRPTYVSNTSIPEHRRSRDFTNLSETSGRLTDELMHFLRKQMWKSLSAVQRMVSRRKARL